MTILPSGYVLTSANELIRGGPGNIILGSGLRLMTDGTVISDAPRISGLSQESLDLAKKALGSQANCRESVAEWATRLSEQASQCTD